MPITPTKVKAICFDIDGTLNDTDDQYVAHALPFFNGIRFLLPGKDALKAARRFILWLEAPGNFVLGIPDALGFDSAIDAMLNYVNRHNKRKLRTFKPIPGVLEMVERLAGNYALSVVSARSEETSRDFLRQTGLDKHIHIVVGALTVNHTKPYPDPVIYAASEMGVSPAECVMVGDTVVDIRAGRAAGAQTVGVLCGFGENRELVKAGADAILETTSALEGLLLGD